MALMSVKRKLDWWWHLLLDSPKHLLHPGEWVLDKGCHWCWRRYVASYIQAQEEEQNV